MKQVIIFPKDYICIIEDVSFFNAQNSRMQIQTPESRSVMSKYKNVKNQNRFW